MAPGGRRFEYSVDRTAEPVTTMHWFRVVLV
jgi:hypothetical protein